MLSDDENRRRIALFFSAMALSRFSCLALHMNVGCDLLRRYPCPLVLTHRLGLGIAADIRDAVQTDDAVIERAHLHFNHTSVKLQVEVQEVQDALVEDFFGLVRMKRIYESLFAFR